MNKTRLHELILIVSNETEFNRLSIDGKWALWHELFAYDERNIAPLLSDEELSFIRYQKKASLYEEFGRTEYSKIEMVMLVVFFGLFLATTYFNILGIYVDYKWFISPRSEFSLIPNPWWIVVFFIIVTLFFWKLFRSQLSAIQTVMRNKQHYLAQQKTRPNTWHAGDDDSELPDKVRAAIGSSLKGTAFDILWGLSDVIKLVASCGLVVFFGSNLYMMNVFHPQSSLAVVKVGEGWDRVVLSQGLTLYPFSWREKTSLTLRCQNPWIKKPDPQISYCAELLKDLSLSEIILLVDYDNEAKSTGTIFQVQTPKVVISYVDMVAKYREQMINSSIRTSLWLVMGLVFAGQQIRRYWLFGRGGMNIKNKE